MASDPVKAGREETAHKAAAITADANTDGTTIRTSRNHRPFFGAEVSFIVPFPDRPLYAVYRLFRQLYKAKRPLTFHFLSTD